MTRARALALAAVTATALAFSFVTGCASPDVVIRNPINVGAIDPHNIVKTHGFIEDQRGLPRGSVADQATLMHVDPQQICFGVSLHEMAPIDLLVGKITMMSKVGDVQQGQIEAEPPTQQTFNGLIPMRRQVGWERYCANWYGNRCVSWRTRPVFATIRVPGPVQVFNTRGRICFANQGQATALTEWIGLKLRLVTASSVWGESTKAIEFVWGFSNPKK